MAEFLDAAHRVLLQVKRPLTPAEIVQRALDKGLLSTSGLTPEQTMKSKLSTDILDKQEKSAFMRSEAGKFTLRVFKDLVSEHIAPRFTKALFDEEIIVFPATVLRKYITSIGLNTSNIETGALLNECFPMQRRMAEEDKSVIQLVSFYIVKHENRYLTYKRAKRLPEARLHGFYSLGFGGHLNPDDIPTLFNFSNPDDALSFILRELHEELILEQPPKVTFRGLLYDDSKEVSKQHIGLVYDVDLVDSSFQIGERGFLIDPKFETLPDLLARSNEFENWSVLVAKEELNAFHDKHQFLF